MTKLFFTSNQSKKLSHLSQKYKDTIKKGIFLVTNSVILHLSLGLDGHPG